MYDKKWQKPGNAWRKQLKKKPKEVSFLHQTVYTISWRMEANIGVLQVIYLLLHDILMFRKQFSR
jgi:hypothetical protein